MEAVLRPKGMGLGADRRQAQELNASKQGGNSNQESGELRMKKGAYCLIENGPHKDLYATVSIEPCTVFVKKLNFGLPS